MIKILEFRTLMRQKRWIECFDYITVASKFRNIFDFITFLNVSIGIRPITRMAKQNRVDPNMRRHACSKWTQFRCWHFIYVCVVDGFEIFYRFSANKSFIVDGFGKNDDISKLSLPLYQCIWAISSWAVEQLSILFILTFVFYWHKRS